MLTFWGLKTPPLPLNSRILHWCVYWLLRSFGRSFGIGDRQDLWTGKSPARHKGAWWWNDEVNNNVSEKRKIWKEWKKGKVNKKKYLDAMRSTGKVVYQAKCETERNGFASASRRNNQKYEVFKMARWMVKSKSSIFDVGLDTKCASAYLFGNKL